MMRKSAEAGSSTSYREVDDVVSSKLVVEFLHASKEAAVGGLPSPVFNDLLPHCR